MRPPAAVKVLLAGLLTGGLIATGATPARARPEPVERVATTLTTRLAPPVVTVGEPAAAVIKVSRTNAQPYRPLSVQRRADNGSWVPLTGTVSNAAGRAVIPLDTSLAGTQVVRVVAEAQGNQDARTSTPMTLKVLPETACVPSVPLVDKNATDAARCLAKRLDRWKATGLMGVGQQLNVSNDQYLAPLDALGGRRVSVVGFDLEELALSGEYEFPFQDRVLADLIRLSNEGVVLSASWHATNPHTSGKYFDRDWHNLAALLDESTQESQVFWADFDAKMGLLGQLQAAGVPVVFRPLHEANGGWFWWGHPDPATYRKLWTAMQRRASQDGVHNIVWAYSFAAKTWSGIQDPVTLLPGKVDLAGIDAYDPEHGSKNAKDQLAMQGYAAVAAKVKRMTMTEVGPQGSSDGTWNPAVITRTAKAQKSRPIWAMLWFDDSDGKKQISSLGPTANGAWGLSWLDTCGFGYCPLD